MYASAKQAKNSRRKEGKQGGGNAEGGFRNFISRNCQIKIFRTEDNTVFWLILGADHMGCLCFRLHRFFYEVGYRATT